MTIWFAADHHFQHKNILTFTNKTTGSKLRPEFTNIQDHDNYIIVQHNKLVKPDDIVYFLGDVTWKTNEIAREILGAMNGRKRLVVGNHDDVDWLIDTKLFERTYLWKYFPEYNLIASHVPLAEEDLKRGGRNVHGHIHDNIMTTLDQYDLEIPDLRYVNVGMERTKYRPWSLDQVLAGMSTVSNE